MLFSSISFLFYFLPCVLIIYFLVPMRFRNFCLLAFSLVFYFYGEPVYTLVMFVSAVNGYIHGLLIDKYRGRRLSKIYMVSSVVTSLLVLGFFKYTDFFIENINALTGSSIGLLKIALPIGISFYTFQILSYTIDVYRGDALVQKSFVKLAAYVTLFPQLIAGPIVRYTTVERELTSRKHSFSDFGTGVGRFVTGLAKKVLIANQLGELCSIFRASDEKSVLFYWVYAVAYSLHIYFDFSGYSDMAIGLGRMFGFNFLENFNYPFISRSVTEFWRRWHMSLGTWFRDYVYIPLGGNRVSHVKWMRNILIVWFLTGFWHGADWTFIIWGLYFAVFLTLEKLFFLKILERLPKFAGHMYLLLIVLVSFVIFNANDVNEAISDIGGMFGGAELFNTETLYYLRSYGPLLIIGAIGACPLTKWLFTQFRNRAILSRLMNVIEPILYAALLLVITGYLVDGSYNPFLYFRF